MPDIDFKPTEEMATNAARGLELREKHGRGGTAIGVARARDISNRKNLSPETVKRMHSYFARHEVDKQGEGWGKDSAGYIAWLLWGGDAGKAWAKRKVDQMDNKEKNGMSDMKKEIAARLGVFARPDAKIKAERTSPYASVNYTKEIVIGGETFRSYKRINKDDGRTLYTGIVVLDPSREKPQRYWPDNTVAAQVMVTADNKSRNLMFEGKSITESKGRFSRPGAKAAFGIAQVWLTQTESGRETARKIRANLNLRPSLSDRDLDRAFTMLINLYDRQDRDTGELRQYAAEWKKFNSSRPGAKSRNAIREGEKISAGEDDALSRKIRKLMDEGKPHDQAVAIALDMKRRGEI